MALVSSLYHCHYLNDEATSRCVTFCSGQSVSDFDLRDKRIIYLCTNWHFAQDTINLLKLLATMDVN